MTIADKAVFVSEMEEISNGAGGAADDADDAIGAGGGKIKVEAETRGKLPTNKIGKSKAVSSRAAVNRSISLFSVAE